MTVPFVPNFLGDGAASTIGAHVDFTFYLLLIFSGAITLIVMVLVLFFIAAYHRNRRNSREGAIDHSTPLEVGVVLLLTVIGLSIFFWSTHVFAELQRPPKDTMNIYVVGKQWMWKAYQPSGREEINALHVPIGQNVKLIMTSQDVIHDFFIPDFRVKQDVVPERYTQLWFNATTPGVYRIRCAQYCGTDHSTMVGWVTAMTPQDYQTWLDGSPEGQPAINGTPGTPIAPMATNLRNTFNAAGCIACHTPTSSVRAPRLDGIYGQNVRLVNGQTVTCDDEYIRESILFPNAKISAGYPQPSLMPSYSGQLSEQQLRDLVAFIKSIRNGWPADATLQPGTSNTTGPTKVESK